jgi:hypothetical protein
VQAVSVRDATRGRPIEVRGRSVQLPPDAEVEEIVTHLFCAPGAAVSECPAAEAPLYKIVRGQSSAFVSVRSGRIYAEQVAPGGGRPFDFVREALR